MQLSLLTLITAGDVDAAYDKCTDGYNKEFPIIHKKKPYSNNNNKPWITSGTLKSLRC